MRNLFDDLLGLAFGLFLVASIFSIGMNGWNWSRVEAMRQDILDIKAQHNNFENVKMTRELRRMYCQHGAEYILRQK